MLINLLIIRCFRSLTINSMKFSYKKYCKIIKISAVVQAPHGASDDRAGSEKQFLWQAQQLPHESYVLRVPFRPQEVEMGKGRRKPTFLMLTRSQPVLLLSPPTSQMNELYIYPRREWPGIYSLSQLLSKSWSKLSGLWLSSYINIIQIKQHY